MQWLRLYTSLLDSVKCQSLPAEVFRAWINLLCIARLNDGVLPDMPEIAFRLRCSEAQAQEWIETLMKRGLFEFKNGKFHPHEWGHYQYVSDLSTPRVKKHRMKRKGNVSVTPPEQRTEQRTEAEGRFRPMLPAREKALRDGSR